MEDKREMSFKKYIFLLATLIIFTGCVKSNDSIGYKLEYEFLETEGKYSINGVEYNFVKRVSGRSKNAKYDSYYVVLTNNDDLTFEAADSRFWGSSLSSDSDFVIVECGLIEE